jgi:predicted oxidoreductase
MGWWYGKRWADNASIVKNRIMKLISIIVLFVGMSAVTSSIIMWLRERKKSVKPLIGEENNGMEPTRYLFLQLDLIRDELFEIRKEIKGLRP